MKPISETVYHYNDVIMGATTSQITSLTIVYSTVYSGADQRKHESSASLAFVRGIHRSPVNSLHNAENVSIWWRRHEVHAWFHKNSVCSNFESKCSTRSQFCTRHGNSAVMKCTKLWPALMKIFRVRITMILQDIDDELIKHLWYGSQAAHDDDIKWNQFLRYWPCVREPTGHRWIPLTKTSDAELWCFLWTTPKQTVEQTIEMPVIWDAVVLIMTSLWCSSLQLNLLTEPSVFSDREGITCHQGDSGT